MISPLRLRTLGLVVGALSLLLSGCCNLRAALEPRVRDRLETYVMVGVGARPRCPLPQRDRPALSLPVGEATQIWLRSVSKDKLFHPAAHTEVMLDAIDPWGDPAADVTIEPATVLTDEHGFNQQKISVTAARPIGALFVRARYFDRRSTAVSLSRPIVIEFPAGSTTARQIQRQQ